MTQQQTKLLGHKICFEKSLLPDPSPLLYIEYWHISFSDSFDNFFEKQDTLLRIELLQEISATKPHVYAYYALHSPSAPILQLWKLWDTTKSFDIRESYGELVIYNLNLLSIIWLGILFLNLMDL